MLRSLMVLAALVSNIPNFVLVDPGRAPAGWSIIQPPGDEKEWVCANYSTHEWSVSGEPGTGVRVSGYTPTEQINVQLRDGRLVGTNLGEFGGRLEWIGLDSTSMRIADDINPVAMTVSGNDVFLASGLAHMSLNSGRISKMSRTKDGVWTIARVVDLGEAPNAALRADENTWILLTGTGVVKFDLSTFSVQRLYRNENWWMLYGNSIRKSSDTWLIGARRAVIRLTPQGNGYREDWLVPNDQVTCRN